MRNDRTTYWQFLITLQFDVTPSTWLDAGALQDLLPPFPQKCDPNIFSDYSRSLSFKTRIFSDIVMPKYSFWELYNGADKSLARPARKQANVSVRMVWISFGALPCTKKKNLMTAGVSLLLKSRASLTCFPAYFLPSRAKDLSAPRELIRIDQCTVYLRGM